MILKDRIKARLLIARGVVGHSTRNFGSRVIFQETLDTLSETVINYSSKDHGYYSYEFPMIKRLNCFNALIKTVGYDAIYNEIGFIRLNRRKPDKVTLKFEDCGRAGDDCYWICVDIFNSRICKVVLDYYRKNLRKEKYKHFIEDLRILELYATYYADKVIDSLSNCTLGIRP